MFKCMNACTVLTKELQLEGTKSNPSKDEVFGVNLTDNRADILMRILSGCELHLTLNA